MSIRHIQTNISGLMRNSTTRQLGLLFDMPGPKAKKELLKLLAKGHKYLPSEGCKHFDPFGKGCQCRFYDEDGNKISDEVLPSE